MRLKPNEIDAIRVTARNAFGENVVVRLFGSRVRDDLKGGDVDLHFELAGGRPDARTAAQFRMQLVKHMGERSIDLVFHDPKAAVRPIDRKAYAEGVIL